MNVDVEVTDFLQSERIRFERRQTENNLHSPPNIRSRKGKEKEKDVEKEKEKLQQKWRQEGRKEIKVACHNINGLKTK
jgi:hypothetical protein